MKKVLILFFIMTIFTLSACEKQSGKPAANSTNSVNSVLQQQMNGDPITEPPKPTTAPTEQPTTVPAQVIDVDLTAMSSTMVYSEVYNMMTEPDGYMGKSVKMQGNFAVYFDETTEKFYYACLIADATACCSQGLEFILAEAFSFPEDYPEIGADITVTGIFDTYTENGYLYAQLIDATLA